MFYRKSNESKWLVCCFLFIRSIGSSSLNFKVIKKIEKDIDECNRSNGEWPHWSIFFFSIQYFRRLLGMNMSKWIRRALPHIHTHTQARVILHSIGTWMKNSTSCTKVRFSFQVLESGEDARNKHSHAKAYEGCDKKRRIAMCTYTKRKSIGSKYLKKPRMLTVHRRTIASINWRWLMKTLKLIWPRK